MRHGVAPTPTIPPRYHLFVVLDRHHVSHDSSRLSSLFFACPDLHMNIQQAKIIEVENRMLLSSLAWFTSLLCLLLMLGNCCLRTCRRYAARGGEGGGGGGGRRNGGRRRGMRDSRGCDSCSPSRGAADMCPGNGDNGTTSTTPTKQPLHWQVDGGGGGGDGSVDRSSPPPGLSSWEVASTAERERFSPDVSRF